MVEIPAAVEEYIKEVETGNFPVCREQKLLVEFVRKVLAEEDVYFDTEQLKKYLSYEKHFPYKLFSWEKFCFALHNTLYRAPGLLRFPVLFICVGRGAGKTGYSAFENFCMMTETNGVKNYDIYTYATSEDQAKTAWIDVYNILEANPQKYKKFFHWTKEEITNLKTNSTWYYCTSSYKTKDGQRPGKIDFDEYHAYDNYRLISVAKTGLGKKKHPRQTITTTNGIIRGGPFDDAFETCLRILNGEQLDNGWLPFICRIDEPEEVHDKSCWHKANPSLRYFPDLMVELEIEYADYCINAAQNADFMTKRMNRPPKQLEDAVARWSEIVAACRAVDFNRLRGIACVGGIDYASTTDFVAAGLLWIIDNQYYWVTHTWVCSNSPDLARIKPPLREWEAQGFLTFVDGPEIPPELPVVWLANKAAELDATILKIGIDKYRYTLLAKALKDIYFAAEKEYDNNVKLVRASDEMLNIPLITSAFAGERIIWGDSPLMRWYAHNSKIAVTTSGNMTYQKIEPKSRKTDGFKAFAAAVCAASDVGLGVSFTEASASSVFDMVYSY